MRMLKAGQLYRKERKKVKGSLDYEVGMQTTFKPPENSQLIKCYYNLLILLSHNDMPLLLLLINRCKSLRTDICLHPVLCLKYKNVYMPINLMFPIHSSVMV